MTRSASTMRSKELASALSAGEDQSDGEDGDGDEGD